MNRITSNRHESRELYNRVANQNRKKYSKRINEYSKKYFKDRRANNPKIKLNENIRSGIYHSLKGNKSQSWKKLVDFSIESLIQKLEYQFKPGMSWNNYGQWHIDHKKPVSWFKFSSSQDRQFKDCWSLANLQPMWASDNSIKGNRWIG